MYHVPHTINGHDQAHGVTIRHAGGEEWDAIDRLAQLDTAPPPPRDAMLVAEVDGQMRAAVSVRNGYSVANPFERSSELIDLLRTRAAQLRGEDVAAMDRGGRAPVFSFGWLRGPDRSQPR
jgi:hypothetical protein